MKRFMVLYIILFLVGAGCNRKTPEVSGSASDQETNNDVFIHEDFNFTSFDFARRLEGLNPSIMENPRGFLELASRMLKIQPDYLVLVDKTHFLSDDFEPRDPVPLESFPDLNTGRDGLVLERRAAEELAEMSRAAWEEGVTLVVSSAYRSYDYQKHLFERYVEQDGQEAASRYSAREGSSQHQLGTTVDFGDISNRFASTDQGRWMQENAARFGWSLSYPRGLEEETGYDWESWHWRWIGADAVEMQTTYFSGIQQEMLTFWNENASRIREALIQNRGE